MLMSSTVTVELSRVAVKQAFPYNMLIVYLNAVVGIVPPYSVSISARVLI